MSTRVQAVLDFWFVETPSEKRFKKDAEFDQLIEDNFLKDYELASSNQYDDWQDTPMGTLALIILFDQFSRNMFRDNKKAFEQDTKARLIVSDAVHAGFLEEMDQRQRFFMMPFLKDWELQASHLTTEAFSGELKVTTQSLLFFFRMMESSQLQEMET